MGCFCHGTFPPDMAALCLVVGCPFGGYPATASRICCICKAKAKRGPYGIRIGALPMIWQLWQRFRLLNHGEKRAAFITVEPLEWEDGRDICRVIDGDGRTHLADQLRGAKYHRRLQADYRFDVWR